MTTPRHLRRPAVQQLTGLTTPTLYRMMDKGIFPRPIKISERAVAWLETEITEWLASRARSTGGKA